ALVPRGEAVCQISNVAHVPRGEPATLDRYAHVAAAILLLADAHVVTVHSRWMQQRLIMFELVAQNLFQRVTRPLPALVRHEKLEPRPAALLAITVIAEQNRNGAGHIQHLIR